MVGFFFRSPAIKQNIIILLEPPPISQGSIYHGTVIKLAAFNSDSQSLLTQRQWSADGKVLVFGRNHFLWTKHVTDIPVDLNQSWRVNPDTPPRGRDEVDFHKGQVSFFHLVIHLYFFNPVRYSQGTDVLHYTHHRLLQHTDGRGTPDWGMVNPFTHVQLVPCWRYKHRKVFKLYVRTNSTTSTSINITITF